VSAVEAPLWFVAAGTAEVLFAAAFLAGETAGLLLWRRIAGAERTLHALPHDRYAGRFATPTVTFVVGLAAGYGINTMSEDGPAGLAGPVPVAVIAVALGRHRFQDATGTLPRPVARARWRLALAEARRALEAGAPLPRAESARLRSRIAVVGAVGDRLESRVTATTWKDAVRCERHRVAGPVACAALLPLPVAAGVVAGAGAGTAAPLGTLLGASAAVAGGAAARRARHRRGLSALGAELRREADRLLERLRRTA